MNRCHLTSAICLSILLSSQGYAATSYVQDFNSFPDGTTSLGDGTTLYEMDSGGGVYGGALRLTVLGISSSYTSLSIPALTGAASGWSASFDFSLTSGGLAPADGFSFAWGAGLFPFSGGETQFIPPDEGAERGWSGDVDHLYFGFDTFDNGENDHGFWLGGSNGTGEEIFANQRGPLLDLNQTITGSVHILWHPTEGASFRTTGFATNINVSGIPTHSFTVADSNLFGIVARNGGLTETLFIDNLRIETVPEPCTGLLGGFTALFVLQRRQRATAVHTGF